MIVMLLASRFSLTTARTASIVDASSSHSDTTM